MRKCRAASAPLLLLVLLTAVALAGCSTAPPVATATSTTQSSQRATLSPGVSTFPDHDTPISSAPPALAATWRPYGVTLIPSSSVVAAVDSTVQGIRVINGSGGAFSDAQVQQFAAADMRDQLLVGWAAENVQPSLGAHLAGQLFLVGSDSMALSMGTAVHYRPCALVPTSITVLPPSPALDAALTANNQDIHPGSFPMRLTFTGCAVTGTTRSGDTVTVDADTGPATVVTDSVLRHDPVLGDIVFAEGATVCPSATVPSVCP